jgi:hypothetical protein
MENPYQSPSASLGPSSEPSPFGPYRRPPGLVHHVRVVAILLIIQGALEIVMGLFLGAMAVFMPLVVRRQPQANDFPPGMLLWVLPLVYGGLAILVLAVAGLRITAGVRNYQFRGRTLGIVALAGGLLTMLTCYCLPTALALAIYGLVVYLNNQAAEAFRMGEAGRPADEILTVFQR